MDFDRSQLSEQCARSGMNAGRAYGPAGEVIGAFVGALIGGTAATIDEWHEQKRQSFDSNYACSICGSSPLRIVLDRNKGNCIERLLQCDNCRKAYTVNL